MRGKNSARWHCKPCDKTSFGSLSRARETIERYSNAPIFPVRAYPCPYGNGYHVTKQEERVWR
jgi:hypothetical protein